MNGMVAVRVVFFFSWKNVLAKSTVIWGGRFQTNKQIPMRPLDCLFVLLKKMLLNFI